MLGELLEHNFEIFNVRLVHIIKEGETLHEFNKVLSINALAFEVDGLQIVQFLDLLQDFLRALAISLEGIVSEDGFESSSAVLFLLSNLAFSVCRLLEFVGIGILIFVVFPKL